MPGLSNYGGELGMGAYKAIIFDVDGTLYPLRPLQRAVQIHFLKGHWHRPREAWRVHRAVSAYRRAIETLREAASDEVDLKARQISIAARTASLPEEYIRECVRRWMEQEPLPFLKSFRFEALRETLTEFRESGVRLGIFSDFPARDKLEALELAEFFDVVLSAHEESVQRFKPDPKGLRIALKELGVQPGEAIYAGDRPSIDGVAAERAGMKFVVAGDGHRDPRGSFQELRELVLARPSG